jgi:predicted ArsR family transcriptional regulator
MRAIDLAEALGWSIERTRRKLRVLIGAGKVGVTETAMMRIDGRPTTVAAYYLTKQQPDQLG